MANERILVVEDDSAIAQLIERHLRDSGYSVCAVVTSGEDALKEAIRLQPDLVLMDITLTGNIDGVETAKRLYEEEDIPVVFLTGMGDETTMQRSQDARAFGFLLKPFRPEEVRAGIDIALSKHRSESKLRHIEHWFSAAIRSITDAVITTNERGTITFLNPVAATLTGWETLEAVGLPLKQVFRVTDATSRLVTSDLFKPVLQAGSVVRPAPLTLHSRLDIAAPVEVSASAIRNDQNQIIGLVLIFRDITERQRAEAALRESEERFHVFMNNSPAVAFIKDEQGRYVYGNRAWSDQFGAKPEGLLGKSDFDLWPEDTAKMFRRSDGAAFASHQPVEWIESVVRNDGSPYHALVFKFVFHGASGRRLLGGLALDITASKEAEAEVSRSREQLRSLAAHLQSVREEERARISREIHDQLGQMLTGLKMDLAWIERRLAVGVDKTTPNPLLEKTRSMTDLLDRMVASVREISAELRPGLLDDLGLVPAMEWQAREFQTRTGIECHLHSLLGDALVGPSVGTAAFRIFQETLTNVARHAQASRVEADLKAQEGNLVMLIRDNGRGITQNEMANLKSLGLVGMRERATILGGQFQITGDPGKGTTVAVRIPMMLSEPGVGFPGDGVGNALKP